MNRRIGEALQIIRVHYKKLNCSVRTLAKFCTNSKLVLPWHLQAPKDIVRGSLAIVLEEKNDLGWLLFATKRTDAADGNDNPEHWELELEGKKEVCRDRMEIGSFEIANANTAVLVVVLIPFNIFLLWMLQLLPMSDVR